MHACISCEFKTYEFNVLRKHIKETHKPRLNGHSNNEDEAEPCTRMISCEVCALCFNQEVNYLKHMEIHAQTTTYDWDDCKIVFQSDTDLEWHVETSHEVLLVHCTLFDVKFRNETELRTHYQSTHMTLKVDVPAKEQTLLTCSGCEYKCIYNIQFNEHIKSKHDQESLQL